MEKKIAGLLGAIAALGAFNAAEAAPIPSPAPTDVLRANSFADLLNPIPNAAALLQAVHKEQEQEPRMTLRILSVEAGRSVLNVHFSASGELPAHGVDLIAVLADDSDRSNVLHGENSGRLLAHVAVARSISRIAKMQTAGEGTAQIPIPSSFQASQGHHLILFAQTPGNGRVLGTDTKPL